MTRKLMITPKKTDDYIFDFTEEECIAGLGDVRWRLNNLYRIIDARKRVILFKENNAQSYLFDNLHTRNLILKCRKLGFSTAIQLLMLDTALWSRNERCRVIAQDLSIAESIFRDVLKFSYDGIPDPLKGALPVEGQTTKTSIEFQNGSIVEVSTNARGTTPTFLHLSEYGRISAKDPGKSREIITGTVTAVAEDGLIFVESTAEGASGDFYEMVQHAIRLQESGKSLWKLEFKFFFYGWFLNPNYKAPPHVVTIPKKDTEYFDELELRLKIKISPEQRAWYVSFRENTYMGDEEKMWAEQPSEASEAFKVSMEGTYFKEQFTRIRKENRIGLVPYDPQYPVSLFWDIGANDETAIWFIQPKRTHFAVINYIEASGEPFEYFVKKVDELNYVLGYSYLPHDANQRRQGMDRNMTPEEMLQHVAPHWRFWLIPRTPDKQMAITQARNIFPLCVFDAENCDQGLKHLQNYRKEWNPRMGTWRNTPRHDKSSNCADAFLQFAQAKAAGHFSEVGGGQGGVFGNDYGAWAEPPPDLDF